MDAGIISYMKEFKRMKWNSSNSSLSSVQSDRNKSIFYTDTEADNQNNSSNISSMNNSNHNNMMEEKIKKYSQVSDDIFPAVLDSDLRIDESNTECIKHCILIKNFRTRIRSISMELENERKCRDDQLSRILRAFLFLEAKIRNEQKTIVQQMVEKDALINEQYREIKSMKERYDTTNYNSLSQMSENKENFNCDDNSNHMKNNHFHEICPQCQKKFNVYKHFGTQTSNELNKLNNTESVSVQSDETNLSPIKKSDINYSKSFSSFETRRSKKYTSRRNYGKIANECHYTKRIINNVDENVTKNNDVHKTDDLNKMKTAARVEQKSPNFITNRKYTEGMELKNTIETNDDWYESASDVDNDSDIAIGNKDYGHCAINPVLECVNQILLQQSMDGFSTKENDGKAVEKDSKSNRNSTSSSHKRVHFSTQNQLCQLPRNSIISDNKSKSLNNHHRDENSYPYENQSIYSNEYEPIGSEKNSVTSNYYVDMESKLGSDDKGHTFIEKRKTPPALPPKPANLLKLQQISKQRKVIVKPKQVEIIEPEPDYCSISEIQETVAIVHNSNNGPNDLSNNRNADVDYSSIKEDVIVDDKASPRKSIDLEESFEDVPKLPNVAEIIPPKKESLNKFINQDNYIKKSPIKTKEYFTELLNSSTTNNNNNNINNTSTNNMNNNHLLHHQSPHSQSHPLPHHFGNINNNVNSNCNISNSSIKKSPPVKYLKKPVLSPKRHVQILETNNNSNINNANINNNNNNINNNSNKIPIQNLNTEFDWYNLDVEYEKKNPSDIDEVDKEHELHHHHNHHLHQNNSVFDECKVEYNLDDDFC